MSGLFGTFNISKRGMMASQSVLNVVSHNISNANTEGYSMQRVTLKTSDPFGMPSINSSAEPGQVGTGVRVDAITRSRDRFLDAQIRKEVATKGQYDAREQFLTEIETILMEPSDTGMSSTMGKYWDAWQQLATNPESSTARTLVAQNGEALATAIRHTYAQLEDLQANAADIIKQQIFDANTMLTQIQDLNIQIKAVVVGGKTPNDLMDRRDLLLDQLSQRFGFDIKETDFAGVDLEAKVDVNGVTTRVNVLTDATLKFGMAYVNDVDITVGGVSKTVDNMPITITAAQLAAGPLNMKIQLNVAGDVNKIATNTVTLATADDLKKYFDVETTASGDYKLKSIKPHTVLYDTASYNPTTKVITNATPTNFQSGSLKGFESINEEVNTYKSQLNNLARSLAIGVNTIHSGTVTPAGTNSSALNFFVSTAENDANTTGFDKKSLIEADDEPAKRIAVNKELMADVSKINAGNVIERYLPGPPIVANPAFKSGNGDRALLMGQLRNTRLDILQVQDRDSFKTDSQIDLTNLTIKSSPTGTTIDSYFKNSVAFLGVSNQEAQRMVTNQEALINQLDVRKESISGVSLDEEMTNMIQFQRAYEANSKMISVIDQLLEVVVNGLMKR